MGVNGIPVGVVMAVEADVIKTGTSTVGITFNGGVVGADHRATMGNFIANKNVKKLFKISGRVALTTAGLVGHAQSLARMLRRNSPFMNLKGTIQ